MIRKGQTALEYLLIVVVATVVVVATMVFMQSSSKTAQETGTCNINSLLCAARVCTSDADCNGSVALSDCGSGGTCSSNGRCKAACGTAAASLCGNGAIDSGEACDGTLLNGHTCQTEGFMDGTLACKSDCSGFYDGGCGDVREGWCNEYTRYISLTCPSGEHIVGYTSLYGEPCANCNSGAGIPCGTCIIGATSCANYYDNTHCGDCHYGCPKQGHLKIICRPGGPSSGDCGNGVIESPELCDTTNMNGQTCQTQGFDNGTLSCLPDCSNFNTSSCVYIVNGTCSENDDITLNCPGGTIRSFVSLYGRGCVGCDGGNGILCGDCNLGNPSCSVAYDDYGCGDCGGGCSEHGYLELTCR